MLDDECYRLYEVVTGSQISMFISKEVKQGIKADSFSRKWSHKAWDIKTAINDWGESTILSLSR